MNEPVYYKNHDVYYCDVACSYLVNLDPTAISATCSLLNKRLDFFDWYMAACFPTEDNQSL